MLKMSQPSWGDIKDRIATLNDDIQEIKIPRYLNVEAQLADPTGFVDPISLRFYQGTKAQIQHYSNVRDQFVRFRDSGSSNLGHVFAGSGLFSVKVSARAPSSTPSPTIRDWALISVTPTRAPDNTVSTTGYPTSIYRHSTN